ncbi:hypothetical protein F4778DRAFT_757944 [Xylariomycetidae sp. FL2044]|nr:hypothetical protein F4778DRAFT_757944 [Xylariomycetidae sp. FL2044]
MTELIDAYGPDKIIEFSIRKKQYLFCTQPVYTASITLTKLSILELYRSIFPTTKMLVACRATQAIVILWGLATMLVTFLLCRPLAYNWDTTIPGGSCGDTLASWESTGISNIITDVIVLVLPIYDLSKIQMAAYKKAVLIAVFALGVFTTAVGIARLIAIIHVDFTDITSGAAWAIEYSALECSVAVTLSCIPLLRPLLGRSTYSSGGTARAPSTWRGTVLTIGRMQKPLFRVSSDNFSQLELHPVGPV